MSERLPSHAVERLLGIAGESEQPHEAPAASGLDLTRYELVREVGRGGMGVVWEAFDRQLRRRVALKIMPETVGLSDVLRRRFAREAQAAARLSHPNIATVYEATPDYIAMQFVEGISLSELPRQPRLAARLMRDAALAVHYAHEHGIVHRDIKPSNLLVERAATGGDDGWQVFVMDFGLAKETELESSLSGSGSILGTPAYMAPEQAQGRMKDADARSDVYGLGAALYTCLIGRPPFEGHDVIEILRRVVDEEMRPLRGPGIDSDLDAIVRKCLAKERARRYATARELAEDLTRWLEGGAVIARPPSLRYRASKFLHRRRAVLLGVLVTGLVLLIVLLPLLASQTASRRASERVLSLSERVRTAITDAELYLRDGKVGEAQKRLQASIAECQPVADINVAHAHYFLGRMHRLLEEPEQARRDLDRALELDPTLAAARFERGLLLVGEYHSQMVLKDIGGDPGEKAETVRRAEAMRRAAIADLNVAEAPTLDLNQLDVAHAVAELRLLRGEPDLVPIERDLQAILDKDPTRLAVYQSLAHLEMSKPQPDMDQVEKYLTKGAARRQALGMAQQGRGAGASATPADAPAPRARAAIDGDAWVVDLAPVSRWHPQPLHAAVAAGEEALARVHELARSNDLERAFAAAEDAITAYDDALAIEPRLAGALVNRGVCWAELQKLAVGLGRHLEAAQAFRRAGEDFARALEIVSDYPPALFDRALLLIYQAERLAQIGRYPAAALELESATNDCDALLAELPEDGMALLTRARVHAQRSEMLRFLKDSKVDVEAEAAAADFAAAMRVMPSSPDVHFHRGLFEAVRGRRSEAVAALQEALRNAHSAWRWRQQCTQRLDALTRGA